MCGRLFICCGLGALILCLLGWNEWSFVEVDLWMLSLGAVFGLGCLLWFVESCRCGG